MPQTSINSLTTQKMLDEQNQPNTFTPQLHTLPDDVRKSLIQLLETFNSQFAQDETSIGTTYLTKMRIDMGDSEPVSQKPYPITMKHSDWVRNEINKPIDVQVICNSHSSWSAPIIVVPKGDGGKHLVINYMALNKIAQKCVCPMLRGENIVSKLNGANYFSTLDLCSGYHHIPLDENSIPKTAFTSPFGKHEHLKVPFGLAQAPAYFQELMKKALKEFTFAAAYFDDIIICSKTAEEPTGHLQQLCHKLCDVELTLNLSKCHFFAKEIQYLGLVLSTTGIKPLLSKTAAIKLMNTPEMLNKQEHFLDLLVTTATSSTLLCIAKHLPALTHHDAESTFTNLSFTS